MNFKNFDEFCSGVAHNISGPTTIAMAHADSTIGDFITALGKGSGCRPVQTPISTKPGSIGAFSRLTELKARIAGVSTPPRG